MYAQAVDMINRMKSSNKIDFKNSWKVITFFIGGNGREKTIGKFVINNINKFSFNKQQRLVQIMQRC